MECRFLVLRTVTQKHVPNSTQRDEKPARSACEGEERRIQGFGGKPAGKIQLGRPRCKLEDNIKMDLQEVGCG